MVFCCKENTARKIYFFHKIMKKTIIIELKRILKINIWMPK